MDRRESAALDRWITREPDWYDEDIDAAIPGCDYCGMAHCECDRLQAEQEADAQRMIY